MIKHFLVTIFFILVILKDTLETNKTKSSLVVDLSDKNLNEYLKNNENVLIKFYTHWCGECKRMAPIYDKLANLVYEKDLNVKIARIEVEENPNAGRKFHINLYPTFIFIRNYERVKFEYQNDLNDLFSFVKTQLKEPNPDIKLNNNSFGLDEAFQNNFFNKSNVLLFLGDTERAFKNEYQALRRIMMNFTNCVLAQSSSKYIYEQFSLKEDFNDFYLILFKFSSKKNSYSKGTILSIYKKDFQNNHVKGKLNLSLSNYSLTVLDDKAFDNILDNSISSLIVIFEDLNNSTIVKELETMLKAINRNNRGLLHHYKTDLNDKNTNMLLKVMKISNNKYPVVLILEGVSDEVNKFVLNDKITTESLSNFIYNYKNARLSTFIGSDPIPESKLNKFGVMNLVGKNFRENVIDRNGNDIFILFCSLSHKHCMSVEERLNKLSQKFKGSEIEFGHIDPISNEIEFYHVKSIPSIVLFLDKNSTSYVGKETIKYRGNYTIQDLSRFIKTNSKKRIVENNSLNETEINLEESSVKIEKRRLEDEELALGEFFNHNDFESDHDEFSNILEGFNLDDNLGDHKEDNKVFNENERKIDL